MKKNSEPISSRLLSMLGYPAMDKSINDMGWNRKKVPVGNGVSDSLDWKLK